MTRISAQRNRLVSLVGIASLAVVMSLAFVACQQLLVAQPEQSLVVYEPQIKVRLEQGIGRAELKGDGYVRVDSDNTSTYLLPLPVQIRMGEDAIYLEGEDATVRRVAIDNATLVACVLTPDPDRPIDINEVRCVWPIEVVVTTQDAKRTMDLVERVPLESYLPGVLAHELYPSWSPVAFRAQAIAARSYALHEMQRRDRLNAHFHVERTTQDQAYGGQTDNQRAIEAVRDTRAVVLTYNNHLLRTYYSSTCGGRAGSARHTWPTTVGFGFNLDAPIQAHQRRCPCEASPRYRWTRTRDARRYARRLASFGASRGLRIKSLGSIESIEPTRWNIDGRPSLFTIKDTSGSVYSLSPENLRLASNFNQNSSLPTITQKERVLSGDIVVTRDGSSVHIEGRGFGHGVGMCQFGAQGLALEGYTPSQILTHYYPGAVLERAY
ncbi:MAG: SpoIID/LytB domain-containing protein [Phycisphaerales bacterium JB043]